MNYWYGYRQLFPSQPSQPYIPPFPPFQGQGGFPPGQGGFPSFPPGQGGFPSFPPDQGQGGFSPGGYQAPQTPPPSFTPPRPQTAQAFAIDPGAIRRCLFRYTYVWLRSGKGFWFYPVFVGRNSVAGFRWRPSQFRWSYIGLDLNSIEFFECSF